MQLRVALGVDRRLEERQEDVLEHLLKVLDDALCYMGLVLLIWWRLIWIGSWNLCLRLTVVCRRVCFIGELGSNLVCTFFFES